MPSTQQTHQGNGKEGRRGGEELGKSCPVGMECAELSQLESTYGKKYLGSLVFRNIRSHISIRMSYNTLFKTENRARRTAMEDHGKKLLQ
ncbi:hypothetical protein Y1Q_0011662 [Alligator mississippiensis]|uniref:Uncharacterized protein n=1 Tax=Alligator mississippiensis TaxID=8496 RepID=A0A151M0M5_ALLMI|nr:hypothetical protein Y1Q_0011662 [Alligator mississippiensis]